MFVFLCHNICCSFLYRTYKITYKTILTQVLFIFLVFVSVFSLLFSYSCVCFCVCFTYIWYYLVVITNKTTTENIIVELDIDCIQTWPERRKNFAQDTLKAISTTPAHHTSNQLVAPRRSIAQSSQRLKQHLGLKQRRNLPIYVKLAEDIAPNEYGDSDSSCYDSFNEIETGLYKLLFYYAFVINILLLINTRLNNKSVDKSKRLLCLVTK